MSRDLKYKINNIAVIYEDDWILVVDKPAGLLTIPAPGEALRTLSTVLNEDLKKKKLTYRLHPCHRLDRGTSGLIIYAKGKSIQKKMMQEFKFRRVKKFYVAFLQGSLAQNEGTINTPLEGAAALTKYRVLGREKDFTVVEAMPVTGRRNQIRLHFKGIGHPLVGESRFAFRRDFKLRSKHLCLCAKALEFTHPVTKKVISLNIDLAPKMQEFLKRH